jgi:NAD+ kinase
VKRVLLFCQTLKQEDHSIIKHLINLLVSNEFLIYSLNAYEEEFEIISNYNEIEGIELEDASSKKIDLVMTLGGDGTMLKAAAIVSKENIPVIGINLGRLGFLASIEKSKIHDAVLKIKERKFKIEERSMLKLGSNIPIFKDYPYALNDFTIHKRDTSSMITIHTYIDDVFLNTYWADGIIVATPTGSTGYSLACGGPIIYPNSSNFVITPIAPHNLNVRPLVINDNVEIRFEIEGRADNFLCTLDSSYETITDEFKLKIRKSNLTTKIVILDNDDFGKTIRDKLLWGLDKRN